jgi:hypothetical protein
MADHETMVVRCPACESHEVGLVKGAYSYGQQNSDESTRFSLVRCPKCGAPFLAREVGLDDLDDYDNHIVHWDPPVFLYPGDTTRLDPSVPQSIAGSFYEAQRSFDQASAYTGAAILCRRTLEGICAHFDAKGGNLARKLADLKAKGKLDERLHEWADHVLRGLGNDAAHDVDQVISRDDARDALEFTKALIQQLFVLEAAFKRFKERRKKTEPPADVPPS